MKYTLDNFLNSYKKDKKIFGDATKYIYEDFFSYIMCQQVTINEDYIDNSALYEAALTEEEIAEGIFTEGLFSFFKKKNPMIDGMEAELKTARATERALKKKIKQFGAAEAENAAAAKGLLKAQKELKKAQQRSADAEKTLSALNTVERTAPKIMGVDAVTGKGMTDPLAVVGNPESVVQPLGFFGRLKAKIASLFSGETSFTGLLKNGFSWLTNPANMSKIVLTGGGIATIAILLNVLKKRRKMKQYKMLQNKAINAIENNKSNNTNDVSESFLDYSNVLLEDLCSYNKKCYFNY